MSKIWIITGVSGGLGRELAHVVAHKGDVVIGTVRQENQIAAFDELVPGKTFGALADVRNREQLADVVGFAMIRFGRIDVLVNNAGYGLVGAMEELSEAQYRDQMEVNFFGALAAMQLVIPHMRKLQSGHIFNVSSIAGINASPGLSLYNASKFALEGLSEGVALEVKPLGISVTLVEPGPFRTKWAGGGLQHAELEIEEYASTAHLTRERLSNVDQNQPGDPIRAGELIYEISHSPNPPMRILLGAAAYQVVEKKLIRMQNEIALWKEKGVATDFPE